MSDIDQPQPATATEKSSEPKRQLSLFDTTNIIVGIIIGASIFNSLPFIAWNLVGPSHEAYGWYVALTSGSRSSMSIRERQEAVTQGAAGIEYELVAGAGLRFSWALGGETGRTRTESDLAAWRAARGAAGRMPPIGFPRNNRCA